MNSSMLEDTLYVKLNRFFELEAIKDHNAEQKKEYCTLSGEIGRKSLYTLDELRKYHNYSRGIQDQTFSLLEIISQCIRSGDPIDIDSELVPEEDIKLDTAYKSIQDAVESREISILIEHLVEEIELKVGLRESILSAITQRHGERVAESLRELIDDELSASLATYVNRYTSASKQQASVNI